MTLAFAPAPAAAIALRRQTTTDEVLIPLETCELTMEALLDRIAELKAKYPDDEIIMDGDTYAIVRRCDE